MNRGRVSPKNAKKKSGDKFIFKGAIEKQDKEFLEKLGRSLDKIKKKYSITTREVFQLLEEKELVIPTTIFCKELTPLESIVKYLKEEFNFSYHHIASLLKRDERNIWHIYNSAHKKLPKKFLVKKSKFSIPVSVFSESKLSIFEVIVSYLREELDLSYSEISRLLIRNEKTIWTIYSRAVKKRKVKNV